MTQVDIGRVALGAPALQQVFVVSRPECLLIKSWARNERGNTEDAAALVGKLFRDCDDALVAVGGGSEPRTLMVESNDRVLVVARVAEDMAAAFVFEQSAPLGLIRVQARQLTAQLARTLAASSSRSAPSRGTGDLPAAPEPNRTPAPGRTPAPAPGQTPYPFAERTPFNERTPLGGARSPVPPARPRPRSGTDRPLNERSPAFGVPQVTPVATTERSPAFGVPRVSPTPTPAPATGPGNAGTPAPSDISGSTAEQLAARVASFAQGAPDARSALLRLSLRTGLPMELLERAGSLSSPQVAMVNRALDELQKKPSS